MSKRDLFKILIRIFALYFIVQTVFTVLPQSYIFVMGEFDIAGIATVVLTLAVILFLLYILIIKTDWIINLLKLDKGFDDDHIEFKGISSITILKFGIIFLGGIFIIRNIVPLLTDLGLIFRSMLIPEDKAMNKIFLPEVDFVKLIISTINVVIGYLILTNVHRISIWLSRYEKNENEA